MESNNQKEEMIIGGNLADALSGNYSLNIGNIIKQTVVVSKKHYLSLFVAMLIFFAVLLVLITVGTAISLGFVSQETLDSWQDPAQIPPLTDLAIVVVVGFFTAPMTAGLFLMGIRHSVDLPTKGRDIFKGWQVFLPAAITIVLTSVLNQIPVLALSEFSLAIAIVLQLYISMIFMWSLPLVAERRISPLNAIYYSIITVNKKLIKFTLLMLVVGVFFGIVVALNQLIGLYGIPIVLSLPLILNFMGVVYKEVFGVTIKLDNDAKPQSDEAPWQA